MYHYNFLYSSSIKKRIVKAILFLGGSKWNTSSRVGKIVHRTIFACVLAGSSPARNLATSFSIPHFQKNQHSKSCAFWWLEVEYVKPRRKNSPPDYFCLRFGWLQSSSKLGNLLFDSTFSKKLAQQKLCFLVARSGIEPLTRGFSVPCSTN